ncbi:TonB-dependent receptor [candidate division KSB1 bacterium]|nr:MAG: TonB-dependent receptor [candidate division KSB1 bacterium]
MTKRFTYLILALALLLAGSLFAGTTGKISGKILDADTNEPLPGANIVVEGSTMGDASDLEGDYNIINLPPGNYTVVVSMMGYKRTRVENVVVKIDMTTPQNIFLSPQVIEGEEVTITAERPLVRLDMTSALSSVGASEIENLPVQEVRDVLELQAGIVRSGNTLHIRGGRGGEVAYWVDGVATTDVFSGGMGINVENAAIEELQVVSGTFNAEYGQAMSGIINIVTKEGTTQYNGMLRSYVGDYITAGDEFLVPEKVNTSVDPETGAVTQTIDYENPLAKFNPTYNIEGSLSGPVPVLGEKFTFFLNGRYVQNEGHLYGRRWYTPQGNPGDSSLVPMNPSQRNSLQGKLTWRVVPSMKVSYNAFWNSYHSERSFSKNWKYVPDSQPQSQGFGTTHILSLNHVLSQNTFYELKLNRFYNSSKSYLYDNPYATSRYLVSVPQDTANNIEAQVIDINTPEGQTELAMLRENRIPFNYIIDPNGPAGYVHPDSNSTPASYSFNNVGTSNNRSSRSTAYWLGKFDITSQIDDIHQLKGGFEYRSYELFLDSYTIRPSVAEGGEEIVPFQPSVPPTSSTYHDNYTRKPMELSAYLQDKLELKEIIMNIGLRFDYFDANHVKIAQIDDPNIYTPLKAENKYVNPEAPEDELIEYTPDQRRDFMHTAIDPKMQLSPRLGIAYPITDRGVIHFSYGHFFQVPEFQYLYSNPDFKLSAGGGYFVMGNADLKPQKTVMYEIGLQQQITQDIGVDVTLFYRDVRDWVGTSPLIPTVRPAVQYSQYENKDYANVRGITFKLEKRYSQGFSARLDYSFQIAEGTYSNPIDAFNSLTAQEEPRLNLIPLNWDQNHTLNGSLIWDLKGWTFSMVGRFWTGRPYTPSFPVGSVVGGAAQIGLRENSERLPNQKSVDLYVNRRFDIGKAGLNVFLNIYNLFDIRDEVAVYGDTGSSEYTTTVRPWLITYSPSRVSTVDDYVLQPGWYSAPRQLQLGFSLEF